MIHIFKNYVLRGSDIYRTRFNSRFPEARKIIAEYRKLAGLSQKDLESIAVVGKTLDNYKAALDRVKQMKQRGDSITSIDAAVTIDDGPAVQAFRFLVNGGDLGVDGNQWFNAITGKINLLKEVEDQLTGDIVLGTRQLRSDAWRGFIVVLVVTIIILTVIGYFIFIDIKKRITQPIAHIVETLKESVAQADLTRRITVNSSDELGEIGNWFNKFFQRVHDIVVKVKESSGEITGSTAKIETGSEGLSSRTKEQATSITETSATVEEFAATVKQNSENAVEANSVLEEFHTEVQGMQELIRDVTETMEAINSSSQKIDNIVNVINDISFQTNLLALNAAVEAARAGEAGRGFAVVATEVRNLAQKTSESSKSIQEIVSGNVEATQKGKTLVKQTSDFFKSILQVVQELSARTKQIAEGSTEQAGGIEQINTAIEHLEQLINRNVQLVEDFADAGVGMKSNTHELHQLVDLFKVEGASRSTGDTDGPNSHANTALMREEKIPVAKNVTAEATGAADFFSEPDDAFEEF
ncbi:MAG: HAMP domain-containing protein [bacterium]|nr:HAMP domain-containing protein [bacterium]